MQRTLAARSLVHGQWGVLLAAFFKLLRPLFVAFPGIIAYRLYGQQISQSDQAFFVLIENVLPDWAEIVMLAVIFSAVLSTLDSRLSSAATIFTIDFYQRYFRPEASERSLVLTARIATVIFALLGCIVAQNLRGPDFRGIFDYFQRILGFISPGIVTVFVFGLLVRKAPPVAAVFAMLFNVPVYGLLLLYYPEIPFLNHMAITVALLTLSMGLITFYAPLTSERSLPRMEGVDLASRGSVGLLGGVLLVLTLLLYLLFW